MSSQHAATDISIDGAHPPATKVSNNRIIPALLKWANEHANSRKQTKHLASLVPTYMFIRELKVKEGYTIEKMETSDRVSYKEGGLLYVLGQRRDSDWACNHCKAGKGPFDGCIILKDFMGGCCANCRYYEYQNRCEYKDATGKEENEKKAKV